MNETLHTHVPPVFGTAGTRSAMHGDLVYAASVHPRNRNASSCNRFGQHGKSASMLIYFKKLLRHFGFEVRRHTVHTSPGAQLVLLTRHLGIDLVIDVGANVGQYGKELRAGGYSGRIVSFEPLSAAHAQLTEAAHGDPQWRVAPRMALGDVNGDIAIHVSGHSPSSSILEMLPEHERAAPGSAYIGKEIVPIRRLDSALIELFDNAKAPLLKIDTQGYEHLVLAGATGILERIAAIQMELSFVPLYSGQLLFDPMRMELDKMGFTLFAIFPGYVHELTGQTLQIDGFFLRNNIAGGKE